MSIALLCPTRGRPKELKRMIDSARATSEQGAVEFYIYMANDVPPEEYELNGSDIKLCRGPDWPTVQSWNSLAEYAMEDSKNNIFILAADDMVFTTPYWDRAILDHYGALANKIHIYSLQDSRDQLGTPHPIVTRQYIEAMGYFLPPIFLHWFIDSWTVQIGKYNDCFTHLKDYMLQHIKPWDDGNGDETHMRIRRMGWLNRDRYVNDKCQNYLDMEKTRLSLHFPYRELLKGISVQ